MKIKSSCIPLTESVCPKFSNRDRKIQGRLNVWLYHTYPSIKIKFYKYINYIIYFGQKKEVAPFSFSKIFEVEVGNVYIVNIYITLT
jgi:hypothetical protein